MPSLQFVCRCIAALGFFTPGVFCSVSRSADVPAASANLRPRVERLLADLDAESRSTRAAARESLVGLGPSILPLLPDEQSIPSAETREAVRQIRTRLERAWASATLGPSRVTLQGTHPLSEILRALTAQSGNAFEVSKIGEPILRKSITVEDASRPFWSACDDIARQSGLSYAPFSPRGRLELIPLTATRVEHELAVSNEGAVRVSVLSAALRPSLFNPKGKLRIGWKLMAEPRLRPLYAKISNSELVARSPDETLLQPVSPAAKLELSMGEGANSVRLDSDFQFPGNEAPAEIKFRGALKVQIAAGPRRFVFDELGSGRRNAKRAGSVTVALQSAVFSQGADGGTARIEISVVYDQGGPAFESYRTWMYHNEAALESKAGRRIAPGPFIEARQQGDGSILFEYNFPHVDGDPSDYQFVSVVPTLIAELPVQFRFAKIPVTKTFGEGTRR